jgi:hypothetical protein
MCRFVCVCVRACVCYPACKETAFYYIVISGLSGCTIFRTLRDKRHDFLKKAIEY